METTLHLGGDGNITFTPQGTLEADDVRFNIVNWSDETIVIAVFLDPGEHASYRLPENLVEIRMEDTIALTGTFPHLKRIVTQNASTFQATGALEMETLEAAAAINTSQIIFDDTIHVTRGVGLWAQDAANIQGPIMDPGVKGVIYARGSASISYTEIGTNTLELFRDPDATITVHTTDLQ